nr:enoyl-CoA hydratase-related protein [Mesorhizobium sp. WSM4875]
MAQYNDILYSVDNLVATITINRPKVLNAFTGDTLLELYDAFETASLDREVGVIVLTGSGDRSFCAGGDVNWEAQGGLEDVAYRLDEIITSISKPVIARVNGYAIGGGNHLHLFCDISIAADHAIFGQNGPRVGSPASGRIVGHAAHVLGHKRAREMWMLCRRYSAAQMLEWGAVNAVVPMASLDAEVRKWADEILSLSPTCLKMLKRTFAYEMEHTMAKDMDAFVKEYIPDYFQTGEQQEGAAAFKEKRRPDFTPWR